VVSKHGNEALFLRLANREPPIASEPASA